jgi:hypothetical protein
LGALCMIIRPHRKNPGLIYCLTRLHSGRPEKPTKPILKPHFYTTSLCPSPPPHSTTAATDSQQEQHLLRLGSNKTNLRLGLQEKARFSFTKLILFQTLIKVSASSFIRIPVSIVLFFCVHFCDCVCEVTVSL